MTTHRLLSDGPLDPSFWTGDISARLPGLFRAGLAVIVLGDLLLTYPDLEGLYGANGTWPAHLATGPLAGSSDLGLRVTWLLGCLSLTALALGWFTRIAAVASWAFLVALHHRNAGITTGGDYLAQILVFFCIWLDCGAAFSLDAKLRGKAQEFIAAAPWRAMQLHVATLYFVTARLKVRGGWLDGDGIYLSIQHLGFLRPLGAVLLEHPAICQLSTWMVLALEAMFAFFAFSPIYGRNARLLAVACAAAVQLGIIATMRVGMFTPLMLWLSVLYLPVAVRPAPQHALERRWAQVMACNAIIVLIAWGVFVGKRWPMPAPIGAAQQALGLVQPFDLFGGTYEVAQWHASGQRADGTTVEVLETAAPGFRSVVGWGFSRYYKTTFANDADHAAIGRWLCRQYAQETGAPLSHVRLWKHARAPVHPGEDRPFEDRTLFTGACPPQEAL